MLTKTDLNQIRAVVKDEIGLQLKPLRSVIREEIRIQLRPIIKDIEKLKKQFIKIEKSLIKITDFLDSENIKLVKRVEKIETHLNIPHPL